MQTHLNSVQRTGYYLINGLLAFHTMELCAKQIFSFFHLIYTDTPSKKRSGVRKPFQNNEELRINWRHTVRLLVDNVFNVTWNKDAFERLVLPSNTKELIKALVMVRTSVPGKIQGMSLAGKRDDLIAGKGNGLIMLLHGGPGTGKTLTAGNFQ